MKKLLFALLVLALGVASHAQNSVDTTPAFRRFPTVPPFKLLESDSSSFFVKDDLDKDKAVLLIIFSPLCEHCQHETEQIIQRIEDFKKVQIVMATTMPFHEMKEFYERYKLADFKNIRVGQDIQYMLPSFYQAHNLPYLAMYDKKGNLIRTFEGTMKMDDLVQVFK